MHFSKIFTSIFLVCFTSASLVAGPGIEIFARLLSIRGLTKAQQYRQMSSNGSDRDNGFVPDPRAVRRAFSELPHEDMSWIRFLLWQIVVPAKSDATGFNKQPLSQAEFEKEMLRSEEDEFLDDEGCWDGWDDDGDGE